MRTKSAKRWWDLQYIWPQRYSETRATNPRQMCGLLGWPFTRCSLANVPWTPRASPSWCKCSITPKLAIVPFNREYRGILLTCLRQCCRSISTIEFPLPRPRACFPNTIPTQSSFSCFIIKRSLLHLLSLSFNRLLGTLSISSVFRRTSWVSLRINFITKTKLNRRILGIEADRLWRRNWRLICTKGRALILGTRILTSIIRSRCPQEETGNLLISIWGDKNPKIEFPHKMIWGFFTIKFLMKIVSE